MIRVLPKDHDLAIASVLAPKLAEEDLDEAPADADEDAEAGADSEGEEGDSED